MGLKQALIGIIMNTTIRNTYTKFFNGLLFGMGMIGAAHATVIDYSVTGLNGSGQTVNATASFDIGASSMTVTLTNNMVNQNDVSQNISGLYFSLSGISSISLANQSYDTKVDVNGSGGYTLTGGSFDPGWGYSTSPTGVNALGSGALYTPSLTILGAPDPGTDTYSNANGSIAANGPHNPFIFETANFTFDFTTIAGKNLDLSNVQLNFGTASDLITATCTSETCGGSPPQGPPPRDLPEPTTLALFGIGLIGVGFMRRRVAN